MYCKHCGKQVDDGIKFCKYCGESLQTESQPETIKTQNVSAVKSTSAKTVEANANSDVKAKIKMVVAAVICAVLLLTPFMTLFSTPYFEIKYQNPEKWKMSYKGDYYDNDYYDYYENDYYDYYDYYENDYYDNDMTDEQDTSLVELTKQLYYRVRIGYADYDKRIKNTEEELAELNKKANRLSVSDFSDYVNPEAEYSNEYDRLNYAIEEKESELEKLKTDMDAKSVPVYSLIMMIPSLLSLIIIVFSLFNIYGMFCNFNTSKTYQNSYWICVGRIAKNVLISLIVCFVGYKVISGITFDFNFSEAASESDLCETSFWHFDFHALFYIMAAASAAVMIYANREAGKCILALAENSKSTKVKTWVCSCGKRNSVDKSFCGYCGKKHESVQNIDNSKAWQCPKCSRVNLNNTRTCKDCGYVK